MSKLARNPQVIWDQVDGMKEVGLLEEANK